MGKRLAKTEANVAAALLRRSVLGGVAAGSVADAQTLEICDRAILVQHSEIVFESRAPATLAEELLDIVYRGYRAVRSG